MNTPENDVIERLKAAAQWESPSQGRVRLGIGDDAALFVARPGFETILTCDWFLQGTHFLRQKHPADAVGWKCLARAVSDVAAMGGEPRCFLLSLALPAAAAGRWLAQFLAGLRRASRKFACPLVGGDTTRRREILINVTVVGEVRNGLAVLRSTAHPGDAIFVSGRLGDADWGLRLLRDSQRQTQKDTLALRKHLYPEPRLALGQWLSRARLATSMMDVSDGLSTDLSRLCSASKVGAHIEAAKIPTVRLPGVQGLSNARRIALALNGGDDYELLFTVRPRNAPRITPSFHGIPVTRIGEITARKTLQLIWPDGHEEKLIPRGWDPFRS